MIAGKTHSEILSMTYDKRCYWYKKISPDEKVEAMKIVEAARQVKMREWWTPERRAERRASLTDKPRSKTTNAKISASWTPQRRAEKSASMAGKNNHFFGKTHTTETKTKQSASQMGERNHNYGKPRTEETKAKMRAAWTPEKRTEMSAAMSGENNPLFGKSPSEKTRALMSVAKIGKSRSEETKTKISAARIELMRDPKVRAKISAFMIEQWKDPEKRDEQSARMMGENNPSWRGGTSFEPYGPEFNAHLKSQIRERDNYTCQECQYTEDELGRTLDVHHIDYDKLNSNPENLISLCQSCHSQTNFSREEWAEYFGKITEARL